MLTGRLTDLFAVPSTVTIAGRNYVVHEARLRDLAELEAAQTDGIREAARAALNDLASPALSDLDRDRILFAASDGSSGDLPGWDDAMTAWLDTPSGLAALVVVAFRRGQPGLTYADVLDLCRELSPAAVAYAVARAKSPGTVRPGAKFTAALRRCEANGGNPPQAA
jgi:hypothetical protein